MFGFSLVKVQGQSMTPLFSNGTFLLLKRMKKGIYKTGQQIVFHHDKFGLLVKTVVYQKPPSAVWVAGENSQSLSTEKIGPVTVESIIGKVCIIIRPKIKV